MVFKNPDGTLLIDSIAVNRHIAIERAEKLSSIGDGIR
jgi:hypothetical protein